MSYEKKLLHSQYKENVPHDIGYKRGCRLSASIVETGSHARDTGLSHVKSNVWYRLRALPSNQNNKTAIDEGDKYPVGAKILAEEFYVDDCISGSNTVQEAIKAS